MLLFVFYMEFPDRNDAIFANSPSKPSIFVSGSLGLGRDSVCRETFPNETLNSDEQSDWCSNVVESDTMKPYIAYFYPMKYMKLRGYSIRNGCCHFYSCCDPSTNQIIDGHICCCELINYSLQGSNDNHTWTVIHHAGDGSNSHFLKHCQVKTFEFPETEGFKYVRFVGEKQRHGCLPCMQINRFELYGTTYDDEYSYQNDVESEDIDESVSIIGRVRKD